MQCRVFSGPWNQTQESFNRWSKGKALSKDVIIHTQANVVYKANEPSMYLTITIYFPETDPWYQPKVGPESEV